MPTVVQPAVVEADRSSGLASSYLRLVRPKQWTKNGFVLAGVVFAEKAFSATAVAHALLAFVIFCALSGAVYAANDVFDVEEDRKHPLKRFRPVASGEISARAALAFAAVLAVGALVMSISAGFVIRALAGVAAVSSPISPWLIVCTGLLTLFLGFSKRRHEIATLGEGAVVHRDGGGNPDTLLLSDRPLQIALFLWLVVVGTVIYIIPLWNG